MDWFSFSNTEFLPLFDALMDDNKTVDKHRQHLMSKLNIHAVAEGIIESNVRVTIT